MSLPLLPAGSLADLQLAKLFSVVGVLAIPLGVLALLVLYQLLLLLISSVECFNMAKYEVTPILHHVKNISEQVDDISTRVNGGMKAVEGSVNKTVASAQPIIKSGEQLAEKGIQKLLVAVDWVKSFFS
jgi:hypothetical protein